MTFTAVIHREGNLFVSECPETGSVSQGKSMEEALENLKEATALYLEEFPEAAPTGRPFITTFETVNA